MVGNWSEQELLGWGALSVWGLLELSTIQGCPAAQIRCRDTLCLLIGILPSRRQAPKSPHLTGSTTMRVYVITGLRQLSWLNSRLPGTFPRLNILCPKGLLIILHNIVCSSTFHKTDFWWNGIPAATHVEKWEQIRLPEALKSPFTFLLLR